MHQGQVVALSGCQLRGFDQNSLDMVVPRFERVFAIVALAFLTRGFGLRRAPTPVG